MKPFELSQYMPDDDHDDTKILKLLLDAGINVDAFDKYGNTILLRSISRMHTNRFKMSLDYGADVSIYIRGHIVFMAACQMNRIEYVKMILDRSDDERRKFLFEQTDKHGYTALIHACKYGVMGVVGLLLANGARIDERYREKLMNAINTGKGNIVSSTMREILGEKEQERESSQVYNYRGPPLRR